MAPYRPPGRSNRSGRSQADNDIFEGLPVKQWTHTTARVSLAPPVSETQPEKAQDRWADPPMPRDFQLLLPYTQHMLRLARSGKVGQKRKSQRDATEANGDDHDGREEDGNHEDANALSRSGLSNEDRAFVARKWKHVPEHALVPEHLHWEFLAKRRKGLPSFYYGNNEGFGLPVPLRKTRVARIIDAASGDVAVYDVLAPEGQSIENEVVEGSELADRESTTVAAGTIIEGIGVANDDGVLVMEVRNAASLAQRRNRPPPKKKGGPGRGKKRVTFTNPDGSTYTTIVPNATKIVPQPGQTVKHVAKGEEAARDISAEEAARLAKEVSANPDGEEEGDDDDDDDDEDGEDDEGEDGEDGGNDGDEGGNEDREDGELADEDITMHDETSTMPTESAARNEEDAQQDEPAAADLDAETVTAPIVDDDVSPAVGDAVAQEETLDMQPDLPAVETDEQPEPITEPAAVIEDAQNATATDTVMDDADENGLDAGNIASAGADVVNSEAVVEATEEPTLTLDDAPVAEAPLLQEPPVPQSFTQTADPEPEPSPALPEITPTAPEAARSPEPDA